MIATERSLSVCRADSIRSYATRRVTVAVLKKLQLTTALDVLVSARDTIQSKRAGLSGDDGALTDELLSRINSAISNYFNQ